MVLHFSYEKPKEEVLPELRTYLENEGFSILEYAPEDGVLFTDYKLFEWGTGRRLLAVTVHVHDKVTIMGMGKMDVPVTDLGQPHELLKIKSVERLPYRIQKRTFLVLIDNLDSLGYKQMNHWP